LEYPTASEYPEFAGISVGYKSVAEESGYFPTAGAQVKRQGMLLIGPELPAVVEAMKLK